MTAEQRNQFEAWFKNKYPHTFQDYLDDKGDGKARVFMAAEGWQAALSSQPSPTKQHGGIGWQLVYMPDGWTSVIDEMIFIVCSQADIATAKQDTFADFRRKLCAAPIASPVAQEKGQG